MQQPHNIMGGWPLPLWRRW